MNFAYKELKSTLFVAATKRRVAQGPVGGASEVGGREVITELRERLGEFGGETPQVLVIEASGWRRENGTLSSSQNTLVKRSPVEILYCFFVRLNTLNHSCKEVYKINTLQPYLRKSDMSCRERLVSNATEYQGRLFKPFDIPRWFFIISTFE